MQNLWLPVLAGEGYTMGISFLKVSTFFDQVVLQRHVKDFSCCITTTTKLMPNKLGNVVTYYKKLNLLNHTTLRTCGHVRSRDKLKTVFFCYHNMTTKPSRVVTYNEALPFIKLHNPLIMWSSDVDLSYMIFRFRMETLQWSSNFCFICF